MQKKVIQIGEVEGIDSRYSMCTSNDEKVFEEQTHKTKKSHKAKKVKANEPITKII